MPKFAANLTTMFPEISVGERFAAAARAGFSAVEFLRPYEYPKQMFRNWLDANGLKFLLLNTPSRLSPDHPPGAAVTPSREAEFRSNFDLAIEYCVALGGDMIHVTAGPVPDGVSPAVCKATFISNLKQIAPIAADAGINLMLEPLNSRDAPGYLHSRTEETRRIIEEVGVPNVKLQYDFYHLQIMQGDHRENLKNNLDIIGHIQFSGVPGRHEPQFGELNFPVLFSYLDDIGYNGWIGCEYSPKGDSWDGLCWAAPYGIVARRDAP